MKKQIFILFVAFTTLSLTAQNVRTVHLDGTPLADVLGDDVLTIDSIAVTGKIMKGDYATIARAISKGHVTGVDMSGSVSQGDTVFSLTYREGNRSYPPVNLRYFRFPAGTKVIRGSFRGATLYDFSLPSTLRRIPSHCFRSTHIIDDLYIPEGLDKIGSRAFDYTRMPRNVYFPASLKEWECEVFAQSQYTRTETNLWFRGDNPPRPAYEDVNEYPFWYEFPEDYAAWTIHVPKGTRQNYEQSIGFEGMNIVEYDPSIFIDGKKVRTINIADEKVHLYDAISRDEAVTLDSIAVTGGELDTEDYYFLARCSEKGILTGVDLSGATTQNNEIPDLAFRPSIINGIPQRSVANLGLFGHLCYIRLPRNITRIGEQAFFMSSLRTIEIPNTVRAIGDRAFGKCEDLQEVRVCNSEPSTIDAPYAFDGSMSKSTLVVPVGAKHAYETNEAWKYFGRIIESSAVDGISGTLPDKDAKMMKGNKYCHVYSLDGRLIGDDSNTLPKGIYVVGGKKIIK